MKIPNSNRKKALILVDIQPLFIRENNRYVLDNIAKLLENFSYDLYIESVFYSPKDSIWDKQLNWTTAKKDAYTDPQILSLLNNENVIHVEKTTKSVFKGDTNLYKLLTGDQIEEVHIIGLDSNDCVLATAFESFDLGFYTYVIEECVQSSEGQFIHDHGLAVLRHVNLTNNSCIEDIPFKEI